MNISRPQYCFFGLLLILAVIRFTLIDRGALAWPDEVRYDFSRKAIKCLLKRDVRGFCLNISSISARPGDAIVRQIPMAGQLLLSKVYGISVRNPESLKIPLAFNVIISLLASIVFYYTTLLLFQNNQNIALIGTVVYSLLVNSNIYIRHILPYDTALLCCLFTLFITLKRLQKDSQGFSANSYICIGLLTGFCFTLYPGYYFFPIVICALLLFKGSGEILSGRTALVLLTFALSALSVLLFFEVLARIGGTSYLFSGMRLAETITEGTFNEGFSFLPKYLLEVEGVLGILTGVFVFFYILKNILSIYQNKSFARLHEDVHVLFSLMLAGFILHATASTLFEKMVFYGRLLHMYFPFLIWAAVSVIETVRNQNIKKGIYVVLLSTSLFSFIRFLGEYQPLAYPANVLYSHGIMTSDIDPSHILCETKCPLCSSPLESPPPLNVITNFPYRREKNFMLVNFCFFNLTSKAAGEDFTRFKPAPNDVLIYQGSHFNCFPAYTFEGEGIRERQLLRERNYKVAIYKVD